MKEQTQLNRNVGTDDVGGNASKINQQFFSSNK